MQGTIDALQVPFQPIPLLATIRVFRRKRNKMHQSPIPRIPPRRRRQGHRKSFPVRHAVLAARIGAHDFVVARRNHIRKSSGNRFDDRTPRVPKVFPRAAVRVRQIAGVQHEIVATTIDLARDCGDRRSTFGARTVIGENRDSNGGPLVVGWRRVEEIRDRLARVAMDAIEIAEFTKSRCVLYVVNSPFLTVSPLRDRMPARDRSIHSRTTRSHP